MAGSGKSADLEVRRSRPLTALWLVSAAALVGLAAWFVTHPAPLPVPDRELTAATPVGTPVYVGVYAPTEESGRDLVLREVSVTWDADLELDVSALVCRGGSVAVTSEPEAFCDGLAPAEGSALAAGDVLVLEISSDLPGSVTLDRVRVAYREGAQWGVHDVGPAVTVTFLTR